MIKIVRSIAAGAGLALMLGIPSAALASSSAPAVPAAQSGGCHINLHISISGSGSESYRVTGMCNGKPPTKAQVRKAARIAGGLPSWFRTFGIEHSSMGVCGGPCGTSATITRSGQAHTSALKHALTASKRLPTFTIKEENGSEWLGYTTFGAGNPVVTVTSANAKVLTYNANTTYKGSAAGTWQFADGTYMATTSSGHQ